MMFKKPKEQVLSEIKWRVDSEVHQRLSSYTYNGHLDMNNLQVAIQAAITAGIEESFRVMIENVYTDAEFEEDLTLR